MKPTDTVPPSGRGWYSLYSFLLLCGTPLILALLLLRKRSRAGLLERFGVCSIGAGAVQGGHPVLWIHAVSMGEAMAIVPLVSRIKERYPHSRVLVSTITETGREVVLTKMKGLAEHLFLPLDYMSIVNRVLAQISPHVFMFVDTELWPNLLRALQRRRIPTILINGRLSSRSFNGYMAIRPFMKHVTRSISLCAMQSQRDVDRMCTLGADHERVMRTGSLKCDQETSDPNRQVEPSLRAFVGRASGGDLFVAASTHHGEEAALLTVYRRLRETFPSLSLLLAPRHLDRVSAIELLVRSHGLVPVRKTRLSDERRNDVRRDASTHVLILDTHGELASIFQFATVVWVGGSWVPGGGHNLMEPAQWGKPVIFGPYMDHVSEMAELMVAGGGGIQVWSLEDMTRKIADLLRDDTLREQMGNAARQVVKENQGALDRTLQAIDSVLRDQPSG